MGFAVLLVVGALVLSGFALHGLFVSNLETNARADLDAALSRLVALIDPEQAEPRVIGPLPDPRYETPLGGRYWQIEAVDGSGVARSRSLWDQQFHTTDAADGQSFQPLSDGHEAIVFTRTVEIGPHRFRVTVGEDYEDIRLAGVRYGWDIAKLFALLAMVIIGAAWVQLRLGLMPLDRLRRSVDDVRKGRITRLTGNFPSEVQPLVDQVNGLLSEREALVDRGRQRASDLAHGLKTPLAALHGIAMRLRDKGDEQQAEAIEELADEMSARVDYQMRLASLRTRSGDRRESTSLNSAVIRTVTVLRKTHQGEFLHWMAELGDDLQVDIHRQDLMELVGITLENASKWAHSKVVVRSRQDSEMAVLEISDDGPGIPPKLLGELGSRGARLDESLPGTGLGLAIATEILVLNGGSIAYSVAEAGGLAVEIRLPLAERG
ncbi:periplasmic sensor signal transduction histidine k inase [Devosia sp. DBB001]|nr:periplasmic sensor signal transduction histidine k inase [Devosia sp. DBB001]